mmetsp:Transcript_7330/g.8043  ORF Transcript_7330/g.8043 Transcript_7330/m.8043 type:complete len:231 (-) Transcript_7330:79-771(-)
MKTTTMYDTDEEERLELFGEQQQETVKTPKRASNTKIALQYAQESLDVGEETLRELESQGERIQRMQHRVAGINDQLNTSKRLLNGIGSIWSSFANRFKRDNSSQHKIAEEKWEAKFERKNESRQRNRETANSNRDTSPFDDNDSSRDWFDIGSNQHVMNRELTSQELYIKEQNDDLDQLDKMLDSMTDMAKDMNDTITSQTTRLKRLDETVSKADNRLSQQRRQIYRIM